MMSFFKSHWAVGFLFLSAVSGMAYLDFSRASVDKERSPEIQPLLIEKNSYVGPIADSHVHLLPGISAQAMLKEMNEAGQEKMILMVHVARADEFERNYASIKEGIIPFLAVDAADPQEMQNLIKHLDKGVYQGIGEILLRHFPYSLDEDGVHIPADGKSAEELCRLAENYKIPLALHVDAEYTDELENLLQSNRNCTVIWTHLGNIPPGLGGLSDPESLAELLDKHPNLYGDMAAISPNFMKVDLLSREDSEKWKMLLEKHSDRIMIGTDIFRSPHLEIWKEEAVYWRGVLGSLSPEAAQNLGHLTLGKIISK